MGDHNLTEDKAMDAVGEALYRRQRELGKFKTGERVVLEKEENGKWHCYYECFSEEESEPIKS